MARGLTQVIQTPELDPGLQAGSPLTVPLACACAVIGLPCSVPVPPELRRGQPRRHRGQDHLTRVPPLPVAGGFLFASLLQCINDASMALTADDQDVIDQARELGPYAELIQELKS